MPSATTTATVPSPSVVVNSMLTALAQSLLPSSTNQQQVKRIGRCISLIVAFDSLQQFLVDLQAAASLVSKAKVTSTSTTTNQDELQSQDNLPHLTQARRRATHNAVERRRRDRINQHIQQLAKLIPDCSNYVKNQVSLIIRRFICQATG